MRRSKMKKSLRCNKTPDNGAVFSLDFDAQITRDVYSECVLMALSGHLLSAPNVGFWGNSGNCAELPECPLRANTGLQIPTGTGREIRIRCHRIRITVVDERYVFLHEI